MYRDYLCYTDGKELKEFAISIDGLIELRLLAIEGIIRGYGTHMEKRNAITHQLNEIHKLRNKTTHGIPF